MAGLPPPPGWTPAPPAVPPGPGLHPNRLLRVGVAPLAATLLSTEGEPREAGASLRLVGEGEHSQSLSLNRPWDSVRHLHAPLF